MESKIGIYWYYESKLIVYAEDISLVKPVEGFLDVDMSHYEFWDTVKEKDPSKRRFEYEDIPRGRIVMDIKKEKFIVYGSGKLIEDNQFQKAIIEEFSLPKEQTVFKQDFHYEDPSDLEISFE